MRRDNLWEGMLIKLVTIDPEGKPIYEWQVFDNGKLVAVASHKSEAERKWLKYKCGG